MNNIATVQLKPASIKHVQAMMSWFANQQQLSQWSGPGFAYPYDQDSFVRDLKLDKMASYVLLSSKKKLLAFGQFYMRLNRCHLGRLVVNPDHRGQGVAQLLIDLLSEKGCRELSTQQCSLFVLKNNTSAIKAYEKCGFVITDYPEFMPLDGCLYMILND